MHHHLHTQNYIPHTMYCAYMLCNTQYKCISAYVQCTHIKKLPKSRCKLYMYSLNSTCRELVNRVEKGEHAVQLRNSGSSSATTTTTKTRISLAMRFLFPPFFSWPKHRYEAFNFITIQPVGQKSCPLHRLIDGLVPDHLKMCV